tara:strand:- start:69 stop:785 length:717 start_codon:yes stop_codon:yes gene_type:complete
MNNIGSNNKFKNEYEINGIDISNFSSFKRTFIDVYRVSIMRTLMNQLIEKIHFKGEVLDIGGGNDSNYKNLINCDNYTSINIDKKINPDILLKVNENFPINDNSFDTCILFNVLEHVFEWDFMFSEITRVLKNKGKIHIIIPFLYPIHGSPNDYIRVTSNYIENYLEKWNFNNLSITPISYGPFSNSQLLGYTHKFFNGPSSQLAVTLDKLFSALFFEKYKKYNSKCPLFYYVNGLLS